MELFYSFISIKTKCIAFIAAILVPVILFSNPARKTFLIPSVKVVASTLDLCKGATISFTATTTNAGANPSYQWKKNGVIVPNETKDIYSTADLGTDDAIQCFLTADPTFIGLETYNAASNIVIVNVFTDAQPSVSIRATANNICPGTPVQFFSDVTNGGRSPVYVWKINDQPMGFQSDFTTSSLNNNDKVICYVTSDNPCNPFPVASNPIVINAKLLPTVLIRPKDTVVVAGTQLQINTIITADYLSFNWSPSGSLVNPQSLSPLTLPLLNATELHLLVVVNNSCTVNEDIKIKVFRRLYMPNTFSPNGDGLNDIFRIPPDVAIILQEFSVYDRSGAKLFSTNNPELGWDGSYKGAPKPSGTYVFVLRGIVENKPVELKETIYLVR
ncbi:MAG: gliding motility-associated C-terminal domain-containing protein [Sphingobacteriales bacterium]|nr:gliding motility-associated C-terminal domain-containing protein [Sphingobacteriales bacterium]MBI3719194.1 gliding motility-associated C-terminal domain-containing protein [Sphingobacteriales bacterium]